LPEVICNTSPLQYLHQLGLLHILPTLAKRIIVPPAVIEELAAGRIRGVDVPDAGSLAWVSVRTPKGVSALRLVSDLGPGETEVLMLALESTDPLVIIDDALARETATTLRLPVKGTLGLLLDAKRRGMVVAVKPYLDALQVLRFRVSPETRCAALTLANEKD
jgi:predicted nucleic acid-binding protein